MSGVRSSGPDSAGREEKPSCERRSLPRLLCAVPVPLPDTRTHPVRAALSPALLARLPSLHILQQRVPQSRCVPQGKPQPLPPLGSASSSRHPTALGSCETVLRVRRRAPAALRGKRAAPTGLLRASPPAPCRGPPRAGTVLSVQTTTTATSSTTRPPALPHPPTAPSLPPTKPRSGLTRTALPFPSAVLADDRGVRALHRQPGHGGALHVGQGRGLPVGVDVDAGVAHAGLQVHEGLLGCAGEEQICGTENTQPQLLRQRHCRLVRPGVTGGRGSPREGSPSAVQGSDTARGTWPHQAPDVPPAGTPAQPLVVASPQSHRGLAAPEQPPGLLP